MLMIGPYQESQMRLDDQTKQDSLLNVQTFREKRIIGIGLELVTFIKKTLNGDESVLVFTSEKVRYNPGKKKFFLFFCRACCRAFG